MVSEFVLLNLVSENWIYISYVDNLLCGFYMCDLLFLDSDS